MVVVQVDRFIFTAVTKGCGISKTEATPRESDYMVIIASALKAVVG